MKNELAEIARAIKCDMTYDEWFAIFERVKAMADGVRHEDGTVELWRPVRVPKAWLDGGRDVVAVRAPKAGEWFASANGDKVQQCSAEESAWMVTCVRVILSDPQPQFEAGQWYRRKQFEAGQWYRRKQFEAGQWYRRKDDVVVGPLRKVETEDGKYVLVDELAMTYDGNGAYRSDGAESRLDLQPGAVTVWRPAIPLKAGRWKCSDIGAAGAMLSSEDGSRLACGFLRTWFPGWVDPPKYGRYTIAVDGGIAVWEGEA